MEASFISDYYPATWERQLWWLWVLLMQCDLSFTGDPDPEPLAKQLQIPCDQKLCEITNAYCCLKQLGLGWLIWGAAILKPQVEPVREHS
jgi:hypothetical protein